LKGMTRRHGAPLRSLRVSSVAFSVLHVIVRAIGRINVHVWERSVRFCTRCAQHPCVPYTDFHVIVRVGRPFPCSEGLTFRSGSIRPDFTRVPALRSSPAPLSIFHAILRAGALFSFSEGLT
jgi:hypothetical protein